MNFYEAQGIIDSLLTGDIARETLSFAENEHKDLKKQDYIETKHTPPSARNIPPGEDIKWICGDCGATDWTPNNRRCEFCRD